MNETDFETLQFTIEEALSYAEKGEWWAAQSKLKTATDLARSYAMAAEEIKETK